MISESAPDLSRKNLTPETSDMEDAVETYLHTLRHLGKLRERVAAESDTVAAERLEQQLKEGEEALRTLEAEVRKESARDTLREADFDRRIVETRMWEAFKSSQFMKEGIPPTRWEEVKQPISKFRSFLLSVSGRVMRVGMASLGILLGDVTVEGKVDPEIAALVKYSLLNYLGAEIGSDIHARWSEHDRRIDYGRVVYTRMRNPESTAHKRLLRITRDAALSEAEKWERAKGQVYRQYSKFDPQFEHKWQRRGTNVAVMAIAGGLVESMKWVGRWLL